MERNYDGYLTPRCRTCSHWIDNSWDFGCGRVDFNNCTYLKPAPVEKSDQQTYVYEGPVFIFDKCVTTHWNCVTTAVSERKAINNLAYRWKKQYGYAVNTKVSLPGRLMKTS